MKYLIISMLFCITTSCFGVSQKLINGARQYDIAINDLKEIEISLKSAIELPEYWAKKLIEIKNNNNELDGMIKFYQDKINDSEKQISDFNIRLSAIKEMVKELEPIKKEYDKQVENEIKRATLKTAILNYSGMLGLPILGFMLWLWGFRWMVNKNKRFNQLVKEGKLDPKRYPISESEGHKQQSGSSIIGSADTENYVRGYRSFDYSSTNSLSSLQDYSRHHHSD